MLRLAIKKLITNHWKTLCLLVGAVLAVAVVSAVPIYSDAVLQRVLIKDIEKYQLDTGRYPGIVYVSFSNIRYARNRVKYLDELEAAVTSLPTDYIPLPVISKYAAFLLDYLSVQEQEWKDYRSFVSLDYFEENVEVVSGRMYEPGLHDGVYEAVVAESFFSGAPYEMDTVYTYDSSFEGDQTIKVRIVGVIRLVDTGNAYWYRTPDSYKRSFIISAQDMRGILNEDRYIVLLSEASWYFAMDYKGIRAADMNPLLSGFKAYAKFLDKTPTMPLAGILEKYENRYNNILLLISILVVPIMLMLLYYIFMVSQLKVQGEKSEISVMQSRGASRSFILCTYFIESLFIVFIAIAAGYPLGVFICSFIGLSNGFLEFINRRALDVKPNMLSVYFAAGISSIFVLTSIIPAISQSRVSVVEQKRRQVRRKKPPVWKILFLDIILLSVSVYLLYNQRRELALMMSTGVKAAAAGIDYMLYIASTLFIIGSGLLFMRLYPLLLKFIYRVGRRFWGPVAFASFHQINQNDQSVTFIMLFLIMALSLGIFTSAAARTINTHVEDNILCLNGADLKISSTWTKYDRKGNPIIEDPMDFGTMSLDPTYDSSKVYYHEPNFAQYERLEGVETAARVYINNSTSVSLGIGNNASCTLMAVDPYFFAQVAWSRPGLNRYHLNDYMNVLTDMPQAVLLSSNLRERLGVSVGEVVSIRTKDGSIDGVVAAFIDFFPGYAPQRADKNGNPVSQELCVMNLEYLYSRMSMDPYNVWIKKTPGTPDSVVYEAIKEGVRGISNVRISSASVNVANAKNDPVLQGTNGMFSLGFIVSMLIFMLGFLIYWILSIQHRTLQFGVFRAMGLGRAKVLLMLFQEQVLVSGGALAAGFFIGGLACMLYVPMFELSYWQVGQSVPFRVLADLSDIAKISIILGIVLAAGLLILTRLVLKSRIDQALKLGED